MAVALLRATSSEIRTRTCAVVSMSSLGSERCSTCIVRLAREVHHPAVEAVGSSPKSRVPGLLNLCAIGIRHSVGIGGQLEPGTIA